jgi:LPXTG-motif cell wall-anchored protein
MKKLLVSAVLVVAVAFLWNTSGASAHHPEVVARNVCVDGVPGIEVTTTAWQTDWTPDHRINTNVRIDVTGNGVALTSTGTFVGPDYAFTRQFATPNAVGQTLTVRATSVAPWGPNGEYGSAGEYRETTVTVAPPCDEMPTTTTAAPTTTASPSTTVSPGSSATSVPSTVAPATTTPVTSTPATTAAPATTAPASNAGDAATEVEAATQVRDAGPQAQGAAQLAFTGRDTTTPIFVGAGLLLAGAGLVLGTRRRRDA